MGKKVQNMFGIGITVGKRGELYRAAAEMIGTGGIVTSANPAILSASVGDDRLFGILAHSLCIPDGTGIRLALRRRGVETDVYPGVELGEDLLKEGVRYAIIGGEGDTAFRAARELKKSRPGSVCLFTADGFSDSTMPSGEPSPGVTSAVSVTRPDIVFLCLGSPKQEYFAEALATCSPRTLFLCLGGSADVYAGNKKRPPRFVRRAGCEWLFRMICEPRRIRNCSLLLDFLILSTAEKRYLKKRESPLEKKEKRVSE